ncbi:hypothetical protein SO802_014463 [Lithocarpus litseifolius]|uniref:Uncharacterized protein n=1 Tax=Lithocarpus litseifolius TaxID=425828 RepID=A0AAW2CR00_9ROSI
MFLHGGEGKTGPAVALWASSYLQEYWSAIESNSGAASNRFLHLAETQLQSTWLPPSSGSFKINVDGALDPTKNLAGIGVVKRDLQAALPFDTIALGNNSTDSDDSLLKKKIFNENYVSFLIFPLSSQVLQGSEELVLSINPPSSQIP